MAQEIDDGGHIYPRGLNRFVPNESWREASNTGGPEIIREIHPGMSRRDWLIGIMVKGLVSNPEILDEKSMVKLVEGDGHCKNVCALAEKLADTIISRSIK